jgi:uncharacterized protein HemX
MTDGPQVIVQPAAGVVSVAGDAIGALKGQPFLLALVLLNAVFIGIAGWYFNTQQHEVSKLVDKMFDRCLPEAHVDKEKPSP